MMELPRKSRLNLDGMCKPRSVGINRLRSKSRRERDDRTELLGGTCHQQPCDEAREVGDRRTSSSAAGVGERRRTVGARVQVSPDDGGEREAQPQTAVAGLHVQRLGDVHQAVPAGSARSTHRDATRTSGPRADDYRNRRGRSSWCRCGCGRRSRRPGRSLDGRRRSSCGHFVGGGAGVLVLAAVVHFDQQQAGTVV